MEDRNELLAHSNFIFRCLRLLVETMNQEAKHPHACNQTLLIMCEFGQSFKQDGYGGSRCSFKLNH